MTESRDQVVLVNERDEVIGSEDKFAAHQIPAKLHRAISMWMVDTQGRLLLQQRSSQKIVGAGWWGNTVCGNVWPGESYEACALRRLQVELGISSVQLDPLVKFHYQASANHQYNEHEMDQVFGSRVDSSQVMPQPNPEEVTEVLWVSARQFVESVDAALAEFAQQQGRPFPTVAETVQMTAEELRRFTPPLTVHLERNELLVVPWTLLMVQLPEVRAYLGA